MSNFSNLEDYIKDSKSDIKFYFVLFVIFFLVLLLVSYVVNAYYIMYSLIIHLLFCIGKISSYLKLVKIKNYIIYNNMFEVLNGVEFWNGESYMLTSKYMFIIEKRKVIHFSYDSIKKIYKKIEFSGPKIGSSYFSEYLHIQLGNNSEYKILIWTTVLINEELRDITDFLLEKNSQIQIINN